jgi:heme-degrading monooxygenase HmoA
VTAFAYVWEYRVAPGREADFEQTYGPDGAWARLFRRDPDYLGTDLLRDATRPGRYVTVDRWSSEESWRRFRGLHATDYEALDLEGATLTTEETHLGDFALA